jgi:hypothetical protein
MALFIPLLMIIKSSAVLFAKKDPHGVQWVSSTWGGERVLIFDFGGLISIQDQVCPLFDSLHMSLVFLVRPRLLLSL